MRSHYIALLILALVFVISEVNGTIVIHLPPLTYDKQVNASEILGKIERGESANYSNAIINDDIELDQLKLQTVHINGTESDLKIVRSSVNIEYSLINGSVDFSNALFLSEINIWGCIFLGDVDLGNSDFSESVSFVASQFNQSVNFQKSRFNGSVSFMQSIFRKSVDFNNSVFNEYGSFYNTEFLDDSYFEEAQFNLSSFQTAQFNKTADFEGAQFKQSADFMWIIFNQSADFGRQTDYFDDSPWPWLDYRPPAQFEKDVDFRAVQFKQTADFEGVKFNQTADFEGSHFNQSADFSEAQFNQSARFCNHKSPYIGGTEFDQNVSFGKAQFNQFADFSGSNFNQSADFEKAQFNQSVDFSEAQFNQSANFEGSNFNQSADFSEAQFKQDAYFHRAQFKEYVIFDWSYLKSAHFDQTAILRELSLKGTKIDNLNLTDAKFSGIELRSWDGISHMEFDEMAYQLLLSNFRNRNLPDDANKCYYDYRDGRRSNSQWIKDSWLYQPVDYGLMLFYGYGVKPERPVIWALVFIAFFALLFWWRQGIMPVREGEPESEANRFTPLEAMAFSGMTFLSGGKLVFDPPEYRITPGRPWRDVQICKALFVWERLMGMILIVMFAIAVSKTIILGS